MGDDGKNRPVTLPPVYAWKIMFRAWKLVFVLIKSSRRLVHALGPVSTAAPKHYLAHPY